MKILLIEDSRFLRAAIERLLVQAGHEVAGMADGREALLAARRSAPAVIFLDMMLPGLEGTCVLKELKQDPSTSHIPVIVLTGLSQENEPRLRKSGAAGYIQKSSLHLENADALLKAIASAVGATAEVQAGPAQQRCSNADAGESKTEERGVSGGAA